VLDCLIVGLINDQICLGYLPSVKIHNKMKKKAQQQILTIELARKYERLWLWQLRQQRV